MQTQANSRVVFLYDIFVLLTLVLCSHFFVAGPGILSMANAGENTNRRQFFLTFSSCEHLNKKHSVFGVVIGEGLEVLKKMEKISTDKKDRPLETITILDTIIVENPVQEAEAAEKKRIEARVEARERKLTKSDASVGQAEMKKAATSAALDGKPQIGRYLSNTPTAAAPTAAAAVVNANSGSLADLKRMMPKPGKKKPTAKFGNFGGW